jgi:hypothetical protein
MGGFTRKGDFLGVIVRKLIVLAAPPLAHEGFFISVKVTK